MCKKAEFLFFQMMLKDLVRIVEVIAAVDIETNRANKSLK